MKAILLALLVSLLAGCLGLGLSPEQLKASAGMATCTNATSIYGKGSTVTANTDDVRKGNNQKSSMTITCGDVTMKIEQDVGVALPAGTTTTTTVPTTTTTTVTPKPVP